MARRIDSLKAGELVDLKFHGSKQFGNDSYELTTKFVGIKGEGNAREAVFEDVTAYRSNGGWAYGTSAEKLTIVQ